MLSGDFFLATVLDSAFPAAQTAHSNGMEMALAMRCVAPCEKHAGTAARSRYPLQPPAKHPPGTSADRPPPPASPLVPLLAAAPAEERLVAHLLDQAQQIVRATLPIVRAAARWRIEYEHMCSHHAAASQQDTPVQLHGNSHADSNGGKKRSRGEENGDVLHDVAFGTGSPKRIRIGDSSEHAAPVHSSQPHPGAPSRPSALSFLVQQFRRLDAHHSLLLRSNTVAARASSVQGQAFLKTCSGIWTPTSLSGSADESDSTSRVDVGAFLYELKSTWRAAGLAVHLAPLFGLLCSLFDVPAHRTSSAFLLLSIKGSLSSSVRLGILGPMQAQRLQWRVQRVMWMERNRTEKDLPYLLPVQRGAKATTPSESASNPHSESLLPSLLQLDLPLSSVTSRSPLLEILQTGHDRLWTRLFNT
jgi:urease accessory protein UreF